MMSEFPVGSRSDGGRADGQGKGLAAGALGPSQSAVIGLASAAPVYGGLS